MSCRTRGSGKHSNQLDRIEELSLGFNLSELECEIMCRVMIYELV